MADSKTRIRISFSPGLPWLLVSKGMYYKQARSDPPPRFYYPVFLVGPYLDFASYMSLIDETIYKANGSKNETEKKGRLVPKGRKRVAYRKLITGLVFLGLFVTQNGKFNFSVSLQDQFIKESLLYRYVPFHKLCTLLFTYSYEK